MGCTRTISYAGLFVLTQLTWAAHTSAVVRRPELQARAPSRPTSDRDTRDLAPVSWTCPMHPEVVDGKSGSCPICRMTLVPIRLELVWTCPVHSEIAARESGRCRICGRDLNRVIKGLSWTCRVHQAVDELNPGACAKCTRPLVAKYTDRPHGDHNPKHGGMFTMAPNNWHLESTHPAPGVFHLHVYDEYSKPFIPAQFTARLLAPSGSPAPHADRSEVSVPFKRTARGQYLEARIPTRGLPASIVVKARFHANEAEYQFDFFFSDHSKEPVPRPPSSP